VKGQATRHALGQSGAAAMACYLLITFFSLIQDPGRTTLDTRVELTERPASFLASAFSLWQPLTNFGEIQNQAYGYLFPQGTVALLLDQIAVPAWVGQRLWTALVLIVACEGARRVARQAGLHPGADLVAGLAFAFSPRLLGTVPVISAESLPGAVMPWVLLPVLLTLRRRLRPRDGALLSGAAVVCMGGVNAVENAAALPLVLIVVVWGIHRRLAPRRFAVQWLAFVAAASAWWALPLLVLARVSPPFYQYVESAANTTAIVGWSEAIRGDSHWVAYLLTGNRPVWPAANYLVSDPTMIVVAAVVTAIGFVGLVRYPSDLRTPLAISVLLGLGAMTIAHGGWEGSPLGSSVREALDGPLQIFRNVHKIDPVVRLPVALGFAHAAWELVLRATVWRPRLTRGRPILLILPACLVLTLGYPYLDNNARIYGWERIPEQWQEAHDYLAAHEDGRATLIVPGSGFARQDWGWTMDEPMAALGDDVAWVTRSQVPLVPGQSIRYLTGLDQVIVTGRATDGLAEQLARAGIGYVLVRRDLMRAYTDSPQPGGAKVSVDAGGLDRVATFGDDRDGGPRIEIYAVDEMLPSVRSTPVSSVSTVSGAPESVLGVSDEDIVQGERMTVSDGEPHWNGGVDVVTDGNQRRERSFGRVTEALSALMAAGDPYRVNRAVHDYPVAEGADQVTARYVGLARLSASSSQGFADTFGAVVPQAGPYSAVDRDPRTRWVSSPIGKPREQWVRMDFTQDRPVRVVNVSPVVDDAALVPIRQLEVRAGTQRRLLTVNPTGVTLTAQFDGIPVPFVEVRVTEAGTAADRGPVAISDIAVDDLVPRRSFAVPGELGPDDSFVLESDPGARACRPTGDLPDCDDARIRGSEEPSGMRRSVATSGGAAPRMHGLAVARGTREAAVLLEPIGVGQEVGATSVYGDDPMVSSRFVYDGDPRTVWISEPRDPSPTLIFQWSRPRTISSIAVTGAGETPTYRQINLRGGQRVRHLRLEGGTDRFRPLTTRRLEITFRKRAPGVRVAVSELELGGADVTVPFKPDTPTGAVCGLGPNIRVDEQVVPTLVSGTMRDVVLGSPLRLQACGPHPGRSWPDGPHQIVTPPTREFEVTRLAGTPSTTPASAARPATVETWEPAARTIRLGAGPESVIAVPENFNPGWVATLDGTELTPLRVDGWQQGWIVPAGDTADVHLRFAPQGAYRFLLVLGMVVSGLVLLVGLFIVVRRTLLPVGPAPWPPPASWSTPSTVVGTVLLLLGLGGVAAAAMVLAALTRGGSTRVLGILVVLLVGSAVLDCWAPAIWPESGADAMAAAAAGLLAGLVAASGGDR
jgi:arabinofuranan 3-O-arabinosyltransferase